MRFATELKSRCIKSTMAKVQYQVERKHDDSSDEDTVADDIADIEVGPDDTYLTDLANANQLHLTDRTAVEAILDREGPVGLFFLFFDRDYAWQVVGWTNAHLAKKEPKPYLDKIDLNNLLVYLGGELYMSCSKLPRIPHYWNAKLLDRNGVVSKYIPRNEFQCIQSNLKIYSPAARNNKKTDALWHSRELMINFLQNSTKLVNPAGCVALDKTSIRS